MTVLVGLLAVVALALAFGYVALRCMEARERRGLERDVAERLEELVADGRVEFDAEAAGVALVDRWLDDLGHDPNRSEIRVFAKSVSTRPPAKVHHAGRVTKRA